MSSEPTDWPDEPVEQVLAEARPLPPFEETVIKGLTEEESRVFFETIMNA